MTNTTKLKLLILIAIAWVMVRGGGEDILPGGDAPIKAKAVVIIEDTNSRGRLPVEQLSILTSTKFKERYESQGVPVRIIEELQLDELDDSLLEEVDDLEIGSLPWLIVSNGRSGVSQELPGTIEETQTLIDPYFE